MSISLQYLKDEQGVLLRATTEIVHGKDLIAATKEIYSSPERVRKLRFAILDYRLVQHIDVSQSELQQIVALNRDASRVIGSSVIVVIASTQLAVILHQQWATLLETTYGELKIFFRYTEALEWIRERVYNKFFIQLEEIDLPDYADDAPDADVDIEIRLLTILQNMLDALCNIARIPVGLIMRVHHEHLEVFVASRTENNPYSPGDQQPLMGSGLYCEHVVKTHAKLKVINALKSEEWDHSPALQHGFISYLGYPLLWPSGEMFGTICLLDVQENPYNRTIEKLMSAFRDMIETHLRLIMTHQELSKHLLQLSRLHIDLEKQARTDELTGLFNRKTFASLVDTELARKSRSGTDLCFCLCDIDHFKRVNDSYGHDVGDIVLKTLANRLKNTLRKYDVIWRWGGEEFLIMCPDYPLQMGVTMAERLRENVARQPVLAHDVALNVTMSFGVTMIMPEEEIHSCLKRCDELLYLAKKNGRNRVVSDHG